MSSAGTKCPRGVSRLEICHKSHEPGSCKILSGSCKILLASCRILLGSSGKFSRMNAKTLSFSVVCQIQARNVAAFHNTAGVIIQYSKYKNVKQIPSLGVSLKMQAC